MNKRQRTAASWLWQWQDMSGVVVRFLAPRDCALLGVSSRRLARTVARVVFDPVLADWDRCVWQRGADEHAVAFMRRLVLGRSTFHPTEAALETTRLLKHRRPSPTTTALHQILFEMTLASTEDVFTVFNDMPSAELDTLRDYRDDVCRAALPTFSGLKVPRLLGLQSKVADRVYHDLVQDWAVRTGVAADAASKVARLVYLGLCSDNYQPSLRPQGRADIARDAGPLMPSVVAYLRARGATSPQDTEFAARLLRQCQE